MYIFCFRPNYDTFIGGVLAIIPEQYKKINGFSNLYFGWGTEDDDFYKRSDFYSCGLSTATIEYSCPSECISVFPSFRLCVCVHDN